MKWDGQMIFNHPDNPFLKEIPINAQVHPNSDTMIALIKSHCGDNGKNTYVVTGKSFGNPTYFATNKTRKKDIKITLYNRPDGKSKLVQVPLPIGARAAEGSDAHLNVLNINSRCVYEFWLGDTKGILLPEVAIL